MGEEYAKILVLCLISLLMALNGASSAGVFQQFENEESLSCDHGFLRGGNCVCDPCFEGRHCENYVDHYSPRFLVHKATIVIPANVSGIIYRAWSSDDDLGLTCPLGPGDPARCPCATIRYQLFSSPGDHKFFLQSDTGILSRKESNSHLEPYKTYYYKLMAQSIPVANYTKDLLYDILDLGIFVGSSSVETIPWT